jgi:FixJ family two-component response regulator
MGDTTIGVVDDDRAVRRGLTRLLEALGYRVEVYESAGEFLQQSPLDAVHCLLVDVRMPGMTGFDFLEQLRRRGYDKPIIFITGDDDTLGAMQNGESSMRVLVKPFDEDALLDALAECLRDAPPDGRAPSRK